MANEMLNMDTVPVKTGEKPLPRISGKKKAPKEPVEKGPSRLFTEFYLAMFLFLIAAGVAAAYFILRPLIDEIKGTNVQTEQTVMQAQNERAYLASLERSIAAAQGISPDVFEKVNQAIPDDSNIPSLLVQMGDVAKRNGVRITNIGFSESKGGGTANVQPVEISLSLIAPGYFDMKRYLSDLEHSLRVLDVLSLSTAGTDGAGNVSFTITVRGYVFAPPATPTP